MYELDISIDNTVKVRYKYMIKLLFYQIFLFLVLMTVMIFIDNLILINLQSNNNCVRFNYENTANPYSSFLLKNKFRVNRILSSSHYSQRD